MPFIFYICLTGPANDIWRHVLAIQQRQPQKWVRELCRNKFHRVSYSHFWARRSSHVTSSIWFNFYAHVKFLARCMELIALNTQIMRRKWIPTIIANLRWRLHFDLNTQSILKSTARRIQNSVEALLTDKHLKNRVTSENRSLATRLHVWRVGKIYERTGWTFRCSTIF